MAYFVSLGKCPRIDRDDAAVVGEYVGALARHSGCLAEEFDQAEAFDLFSIDGSLYDPKPGTGLRESSVMFGARPPAPPKEPPPPLPQYRHPEMQTPEPMPKPPPGKRRPRKAPSVYRQQPAIVYASPPRQPAMEYEYQRDNMKAIREFLIPKWLKDGQSEKQIREALHSAWPAAVIAPILKEFFPIKEWPFTYA
jgi:hypothetical protein